VNDIETKHQWSLYTLHMQNRIVLRSHMLTLVYFDIFHSVFKIFDETFISMSLITQNSCIYLEINCFKRYVFCVFLFCICVILIYLRSIAKQVITTYINPSRLLILNGIQIIFWNEV